MPIYDLDEESTLFEPLKIKLGGVELTIEDVPWSEFEKITAIKDPYEQLARFAKVDVKVLQKVTMKKISSALKIIGKESLGPAAGSFVPKKV